MKGAQGVPGGGLAGAGEEGPGALLISTHHPMSQGVIQGTVPYLGTFLTDLVMLDTAMKDYLYVSEPRGWAGLGWGSRALRSQQRACLVSRVPPAPMSVRQTPAYLPLGGARGRKGSRLQPLPQAAAVGGERLGPPARGLSLSSCPQTQSLRPPP